MHIKIKFLHSIPHLFQKRSRLESKQARVTHTVDCTEQDETGKAYSSGCTKIELKTDTRKNLNLGCFLNIQS